MISCRTLPLALLLAACGASSQPDKPTGSGAAEPDDRPNFIVIVTDDQRYDALGILDDDLKTPNMDRLAREGVHFANAFVTTSLCSPSRATILSGRPMREHGVVDNNSDLGEDIDTFPKALDRAGYDTAMIGKWHMGGEDDSPRPGFDRWVSFAGQGNYYPRGFMGGPSYLNVDGERVEQQGYITDELTDYALDWLEQRKTDSDPFMLYLAHKAVHAFFEPAPRHEGMYDDMPIRDVIPSQEEMQQEPMWVQNQRNSWHGVDFPYHTTLSLPDYKRDYLETLTAVDDSLGRIFEWLEESGEADNTYLIFMSDNGFLFGEHGLIDKRNAFEESIRIPLLIRGPGVRSGVKEEGSVTTLDIAPTLLELAGATSAAELRGRSLAPVLEGNVDDWDNELVYEYFWEFNYPHTPTQFAIRSDRYKLVRLHGVWDEDALYDLQNDPGETNNLIADPDHLEIRLELQDRLHAAIANQDGKGNVPFTSKFNQGAVFRSVAGPEAAEFPERWLREDDAEDRLEHVIPDGPAKAETLRRITEAFEEGQRQRSDQR